MSFLLNLPLLSDAHTKTQKPEPAVSHGNKRALQLKVLRESINKKSEEKKNTTKKSSQALPQIFIEPFSDTQ
jgi:hypothetical protein